MYVTERAGIVPRQERPPLHREERVREILAQRVRTVFRNRDKTYELRDSEIHLLSEVGKFRVVAQNDLAEFAYNGDRNRVERDIENLVRQGLADLKTILIVLNAANSQIARCLIGIAKSRDLNVIGIVRRPELVPEIKKLGADFVGVESPELSQLIQIATGGKAVTLGLDAVGGPSTAAITGVLSLGAHLVSYAWLSGLSIHVPQGDLIGKRLNIHGFWMYYEEYLPRMRAALTEAAKVVASGKLSLTITATYKPSQIKEAIEHYERGGKVLLDFN